LVVALLSAVRFLHHQRSRCRPLSPINCLPPPPPPPPPLPPGRWAATTATHSSYIGEESAMICW
jgi:hypothetical protein